MKLKKRRDNSDQKCTSIKLHSDVHNFIQKINNALVSNGDDFSKKCLEKLKKNARRTSS